MANKQIKDAETVLSSDAISPADKLKALEAVASLRTLIEEDIPRMLEHCEERLDQLEDALDGKD